ncbi:MAG TPA: hypothetical protein VMS96_11585 [Terriglobales bacterium]|nr:hypothetical protein [Terriglobales bacterium]
MSSSVTSSPEAMPPAPAPGKRNAWALLRGLSWRVKIALPLVLAGIGFVVYLTGKSATLKLTCQHNLRSGEIRVWTDDQLVYSGKLSSTKKRFGLFGKTPLTSGKAATFSHTVKVPDGPHKLRIQVVGEGYDASRVIPVDFSPDTQSTVSINALSRNLQVNWKDTQFLPASGETPWYLRYGKALFITLFGSVISAVMGMVVKEILEKLRQPART